MRRSWIGFGIVFGRDLGTVSRVCSGIGRDRGDGTCSARIELELPFEACKLSESSCRVDIGVGVTTEALVPRRGLVICKIECH
jgi:hypothetical protein